MSRHPKPPTGRPRGQQAAAPELDNADGLALARWGAAAASAGLSRSSAARVAGVSRRTLQRALRQNGADPLVARDLQLGEALKWESAGGRALEEATSRALNWLREVTEDPEADTREVAAALGASVSAAHRLTEAGSRRSKRLAPIDQPKAHQFDLQGFLTSVASACEQVRQLPIEHQTAAFETLHQNLYLEQQSTEIDAIDIEAVTDSKTEIDFDDEGCSTL
jgi:uncharacterized protein (DUF2267 family)